MKELIYLFEKLSLIQWLILGAFWIVSHALIYYVFARWVVKRQWRLYRNLKRPIIILEPIDASGTQIPNGAMNMEIQLLRNNGFLNVSSQPSDYRSFNPVGKHCIVVLGYKEGMAGLDDVIARIKTNHVPLVVYTYGDNDIATADKSKFVDYPYTLYANFPLSLLNHIFSTVASYPYEHN